MSQNPTVDQLMAAARSVTTTFEALPPDPVVVAGPADIGDLEASRIADRYARHGFAIFRMPPDQITPQSVLHVAESLKLGEPFVPPLYNHGASASATVHRISAASNAGTADADHPSFGRSVGQQLHCDGTLQPVGFIKASLLLCETPAADGGDTTLFNSSAAFAQLITADMAAATALAVHGTLVRQANINGCADINLGSAVSVHDGRLVCWYCVTETDSWAVPDGVSAADLHRGIGFMLHASQPGSSHFVQLMLAAGDGIVFDNTRISHGRTAYLDSADSRRCLYRSLHLRHPVAPAQRMLAVAGRETHR